MKIGETAVKAIVEKSTKSTVDTLTFTVEKWGGFEYGNMTCVIVRRKATDDELYDTRYNSYDSLSDFIKDYEVNRINTTDYELVDA